MRTTGAWSSRRPVVSDGSFGRLVLRRAGARLSSGEDRAGAAHLVVLSYAAWQNRYGGRQDIVGQSVTLGNLSYTVIGVLPRGFHFAPVDRRSSG